jgi:hypothetical protein
MAASKRSQKKARPASARNKRAKPRAVPLRTAKDHVRSNSAASPGPRHAARTIGYGMLPAHAMMATAQTLVRCSRPFAEFPLRAAQARTPSEVWHAHARFLHDVVSEGLLATRRLLTLTA